MELNVPACKLAQYAAYCKLSFRFKEALVIQQSRQGFLLEVYVDAIDDALEVLDEGGSLRFEGGSQKVVFHAPQFRREMNFTDLLK